MISRTIYLCFRACLCIDGVNNFYTITQLLFIMNINFFKFYNIYIKNHVNHKFFIDGYCNYINSL